MNRLKYFFALVFLCIVWVSCSSEEVEEVVAQGCIYGSVVDASTNEPVQGVSVTLYPGGETFISGADGSYEFDNVASGGYILQVSKDDYYSNVSSVTVNESGNVNLDVPIHKGTPCLDVLMGELNFGDVSSSKVFVISNIGTDEITWNLYSDYLGMVDIDQTTGTLLPGENMAVNVSLNRGINMDVSSFPIYVRSGNDELGVIATINRASNGLHNSLLLGEWTVVEAEHWSEELQCFLINQFSEGQVIVRFHSDFSMEYYCHQILSNESDWMNYAYEKDIFFYDPANNILTSSNAYGTSIYEILYLDNERMELETINLKDSKEKERTCYVRR